MKKRLLALLLCICLLVPFVGTATLPTTAEEATSKYVILDLRTRISQNFTLDNTGVFGQSSITFDPLDLTAYDFTTDRSRVAIQMDLYMNGDEKFQNYMTTNRLNGALELTSGGGCDKEEISVRPGKVLAFEQGVWKRILVPLSELTQTFGGEFNPTRLNFFRMYLVDEAGAAHKGGTGSVKICNMMLVDTAVPESERPSLADMPIGDGTFTADPPVFRKVEIAAGYDDSTAVFAGYNLKEYLADHPEITTKDGYGRTDYSGVVNSLLEGLNAAGGGTLFIPAGVWEFRNGLNIPDGTSIYGEWQNPDENPTANGTILAVYGGKGEENGVPFINMGMHCVVQNFSVWYPEQTVDSFIPYPPTIDLNSYTFVRNLTMYNPYFAIRNNRMCGCPNAWNIYGTPLNIGADFDQVADIARIEELHFSPDYWVNSGLQGAPNTDEDIKALEDQLYNYAIGITLRRIDWSYLTYSDIRGYNVGLMFGQSIEGGWPNGQCVGLNFTDCKYGHFVYGCSDTGESMLDITMKNCEYGVFLADGEESGHGTVQYYNADLQASKQAVYQGGLVRLSMMASTIRGGRVLTEAGNNIFINNRFMTAAPHIELDYGTVSGTLLGNVDYYGDPIKYTNPGLCAANVETEKVDLDMYTPMTREEAAAKPVGPNSTAYVIPTDLDTTGETDVTEALQAHLTALGSTGGGTVFLTPGRYRINGTLTVPTGVELRGSGDYASIPKALNTVLLVYTPVESGKDVYTSTATITLEKDSGLRGIIINYPVQNINPRIVETVLDPVASKEQGIDVYANYYAFDFIPYPYTVRGAGSDVYLKYVSIRNGWNGVDFKTNRCDNHFIDYLAGHFFNRGIIVGNGSTGGYIRNFQLNYNSIYTPNNESWSGFGGEPSTEEIRQGFHQPMQAQINNNMIALQLGDVNDQLVYNCFNYASWIGVHLVEENGEAANARIYGHGVDYGTVSLKVEAAEKVHFTNMQLTAFNQAGSDSNTGRWAVDQSVNPIYDIWLTDTFEGEITVTNFSEWAHGPNAGVRVDSGRLNIYNAQIRHQRTRLFELNGDGVLNIVAFSTNRTDNPELTNGSGKNLHITAGNYRSEPIVPADIGTYKYVSILKTRHAVPKNANFPEGAELVTSESFDSYDFATDTIYRVDDTAHATIRRGAVRMRLGSGKLVQGLKAGQNKNEAMPFVLESGGKNAVYRMEWRLSIDEMRETDDSEIYLFLSNAETKNQIVCTIKRDGTVYDQNGNAFGKVERGTYYRLAVEVDTRNTNAKTATVYLLNDQSEVIARGGTAQLRDAFQGDNTVCGFWFAAMATPGEAPESETDWYVDYFYVVRSAESTLGGGLLGDVNGDGKVDSTDARLTLQLAVKKISSLPNAAAADVNGDGKIDSTDARLILQYAVKKIEKLPAA